MERSRKSGMWYVVPYKRAVDKTSQGLRERDKDDGPKITNLPASLRGAVNGGKVPKPNLSDLAQVTMAQAGMPIRSQKPPPQPLSKTARHQHQQQQRQKSIQQQRQQQMMQQQQLQMPNPCSNINFGMEPPDSMVAATPGNSAALEDPLSPQPGLLSSQSSMFRLFSRFGGGGRNDNANQQQMGGATRSSWTMGFVGGGGVSNNMINNNNNQIMNNINMNMNPADPAFAGTVNTQQQMQIQEMQRQQMQQLELQQMQQRQQQQQQQRRQQQQDGSVPAPSLTRLTTQVSDWLTSFWPVNKTGAAARAPGANQQPLQDPSNPMGYNDKTGFADMHQINSARNMQQQQMMAMINDSKPGMNVAPSLGAAQMDDGDAPIPPSAGRLESSVSTTLLKLASSPSKIFAGISTFFSSNNNEDELPPADTNLFDEVTNNEDDNKSSSNSIPPPPPSGLGMPVGRRSSRKSSDLLDDYEETPMEARLRAVAGST